MDNADGTPRDPDQIRDPYDPARLAESNLILHSFIPTITLTAGPLGEFRDHAALVYQSPGKPAADDRPAVPPRTVRQAVFPNSSASSIVGAALGLRFTQLQEQAIATLIRFVRGRTRRPTAWWRANFSSDTYLTVLGTSYPADSAKLDCVICGRGIDGPGDWFGSNRWDQGACCGLAGCRAWAKEQRDASGSWGLDGVAGVGMGMGMGTGGVDDRMIYRGVEVDHA